MQKFFTRRFIIMKINLQKLVEQNIATDSGSTRKLVIKGEPKPYKVYRFPLSACYYNDANGRIATYISEYVANGNKLDKNDLDEYNMVLEEFVYASNKKALDNTKNNISRIGQRVAGVVLEDGRILDGNRRFTALRKINREEGKDVYFEAVLLDGSHGLTQRDIKQLELNLQHAEERPVEYDPIDNLVDVYRDLIENKLFTETEYAENTNKNKSDVTLLMKKASLMVQFLQFINAEGKFYIARDLALDGPLQEMVRILEGHIKGIDVRSVVESHPNKREVSDFIQLRNTLFASLLSKRKLAGDEKSSDLTREVREIGQFIVKTANRQEFLEEMEEIVEDIYETFQEQENVDAKTIATIGKELSEVREKAQNVIENFVEDGRIGVAKAKPIQSLNKVFKELDGIRIDQVKRMDAPTEAEFLKIYEEVQNKFEEIRKAINV